MDTYSAYIAATTRREDLLREAAEERLVRSVRRNRRGDHRSEPRPQPRGHHAARPIAA